MPDKIIQIAKAIHRQRYFDAAILFAAGSIVRGEGTVFPDLDLVVVYEKLPSAYRESFRFEDLPVEAFVHDPETLNYFFLEVDRPSGVPALPQMVLEGIEVPSQNALSETLKKLATSVIEMGPPPLSTKDRDNLRYAITELVDDLREPRSTEELVASASRLYELLANFYLRTNTLWSGRGKSIPRALQKANPNLHGKFTSSFDNLFRNSDARNVIALAEELLAPDGGFLFDGYRLEAPLQWKKPFA